MTSRHSSTSHLTTVLVCVLTRKDSSVDRSITKYAVCIVEHTLRVCVIATYFLRRSPTVCVIWAIKPEVTWVACITALKSKFITSRWSQSLVMKPYRSSSFHHPTHPPPPPHTHTHTIFVLQCFTQRPQSYLCDTRHGRKASLIIKSLVCVVLLLINPFEFDVYRLWWQHDGCEWWLRLPGVASQLLSPRDVRLEHHRASK